MKGKNLKSETPKSETPKEEVKRIKVKLNYNTYVTIQRASSLKIWLEKYPDAKIITT